MKSHGSARALVPGSGRAALASPTSGKKRRGATDKYHSGHSSSRSTSPPQDGVPLAADSMAGPSPVGVMPVATVPSHELLFQLQQQLQHQHMAQQSMAAAAAAAAAYGYSNGALHQPMAAAFPTHPYMAAPPVMSRVPSSATPAMMNAAIEDSYVSRGGDDDDAAGLMQRLEKKEQMIGQLGAFLSQMQHESEGTAAAWKEKLQEIAELKRQLGAAAQQLESARASEQDTAAELARAQQELEAARARSAERESTHVEELTVMHDEIKKRENEVEHLKIGFDQSLEAISHELLEAHEQHQNADSRCSALEGALREAAEGRAMALAQLDGENVELKRALEGLRKQLDGLDREKHELAQHLWNVTQELQLSKQREDALERKCAAAAGDVETTQRAWSERFQHFESERAEQLGVHAMLQAELQGLAAQLEAERAQKAELNTLVAREIERFRAENEQLERTHCAALERAAGETERWRLQVLELEDKLAQSERALHASVAESKDVRARLERVDEECQHLQQHGSEKASTLQELNNQLGRVLEELEDVTSRHRQLEARWARHQSGLLKCLQLLPQAGAGAAAAAAAPSSSLSSSELEPQVNGDAFPARIASALEDHAQLSSTLSELKIAVLRARQELDSERERARQREQELLQQCQGLDTELATARADAQTLAHELQQLSRESGGAESKLAAQVQQLAKELADARAGAGLQALQLQKSVDTQRARTSQLESEKRDLLQEAEQLNAAIEGLYQARSEQQAELDQLRAAWNELRLEHSDLKESYEDLDDRTARTIGELNAKLAELHVQLQAHRSDAAALRAEQSKLLDQLGRAQAELEAGSQRLAGEQAMRLEKELELSAELEDKTRRMGEMMEMLTQLQAKAEFLEKARVGDEQSARQEAERCQQQLRGLAQDKKRLEVAYASLKAQHDQATQDAFTLTEEKRLFVQQQSDVDEELSTLKSELARLRSELERASRAKASLQAELHRATDEAQDTVRQLEVARRDARALEKSARDDAERAQKEVEELRAESSDASALVEELQVKMTAIQSAANATINELMGELQSAQDAAAYEKSRLLKESEALKAQLQALDDDARRRDADAKELQVALRQAKNQVADHESDMALKLARVSAALEQKRQEVDKLGKELDGKALKVAEYERKLPLLASAKESLQATTSELKQRLDATTREAHELEARCRDELARAGKDKREAEALYVAAKEDCDALRSQASGQQQQWQSDCKALKQGLERAKSELVKANADARALAQRLEACQGAANETIAELSARLEAAEQQKEMVVNGLQREINVERERRREAEVHRMELQRLVRQQPPPQQKTAAAAAWTSGRDRSDAPSPPPQQQPKPLHSSLSASTTPAAAPEIRKFYANEPLTNAELSSLPMALITAQIGLDLASTTAAAAVSPAKAAGRVRAASSSLSLSLHDRDAGLSSQQQQQQENNDDVPPLPLEKLPQNPEADAASELSPSCDTSGGRSSHHQLAALSSRSMDRFVANSIDGWNRLDAVPAKSSGNNSKKLPASASSKKKRLPSATGSSAASAALTAAYASFSALPSAPSSAKAPAGSPLGVPKSKSTSKLLPRIP
ncbi:hypothetical protein PybrP1_004119 [[Pythium] brassicae (nom. inval.)]|nr:hypothetical protein PybrP1_004119 [[Pythium] brassicae (nom. inval.)]